jgi:signal transduction histidine kinase
VRDLLALSAISAEWVGRAPAEVANSVRDLLMEILTPDSVCVEVHDPRWKAPYAAVGGAAPAAGDLRLATFPVGRRGELGRLTVGSRRVGFPDDAERRFLQVAARQVTVALRQAQLIRFHERSERRLRLHAVQQAAVASFGLRALRDTLTDALLDDALSCVTRTLGVELADILEVSDEGPLVVRAGIGWAPGTVGRSETGAATLAACTLHTGEPVMVDDLGDEPRFAGSPRLLEHGVVSGMNVVIHGPERPYGVLGAYSRLRRALSSDEIHFLQGIANVLAASVLRHDHEKEREDLLARTRLAVAARDRAVGIVSHDLGNPLSTIQICANALLDPEPPSVAGVHNLARIIEASVAWMRQISQDLLDRTALESGHLALDRQHTEVSDVMKAAESLFAPMAREHEIDFVVKSDFGLSPVYADSRRLLQVLSNLLGNAMKFTPPGGRVELSATWAHQRTGLAGTGPSQGGAVRFQVVDTGPGIPAGDQGHIFDWFWHTEDPGRSGTGMGLAIAGGLVAAHGARLHVQSDPGDGSTFWFAIPVIGGTQ